MPVRSEWERAADRRRRNAAREKIATYRSDKGCVDCGEKHPAVLQFHHKEGRNGGRTISRNGTRSWAYILTELEKCDVLCANCHLKRHYNEKSGFFAQKEAKNGQES